MTTRLDLLAKSLERAYQGGVGVNHLGDGALPDRESVARICHTALTLFFPGFFSAERIGRDYIDTFAKQHLIALETLLVDQVGRALAYEARARGFAPPDANAAQVLTDALLGDLVEVRELVATDVEAAFHNDPAATDRAVIVVSYPCIEAIAVQRFAHRMYRRGVPLLPRMMTEVAHSRTGIDIHPGAAIGASFFIDHGTGVVIGETCIIGTHCVLYHGVTLGAWNPLVKGEDGDLKRGGSNKRHPDLEDHVTVYPGATILGGATRIGHHSVIGGNVWLTHAVAPHSVVTIKDPELDIRTRKHAV
ncbi:MAG TPA: serine acetyltransferase [Planctomycetota bacterium]|nr:serine acetyltransferase [Planctomycetota bacterium]